MTTIGTSTSRFSAIVTALRSYWARTHRVERVCYLVGAVLIVSGLFHLGVLAVRGGPFYGPVSWRTPVTFGLSFGLTLISITWVASYVTLSTCARTWLLGIFAVDCVLEVAGITTQAWRHVPSHFNTETPFNTVIAMSLAAGGAVLIAVLGTLAVTAFRGRIHAAADIRLALQAGFAFLAVGLAIGAAMIARGEILIKSGHMQAGYHSAGSMKWVHAITLHAILVLPLLAVPLSCTGWPPHRRRRAIAIAAALYAIATITALVIAIGR